MLLIFLLSFYLKNCSGLGRTLYPDKGPSNSRAVASVLWEESRSFAHWVSPWGARHPSFGVIVKDQKPWKMEIYTDLLMENHVFTEAVLKWPPPLLLE